MLVESNTCTIFILNNCCNDMMVYGILALWYMVQCFFLYSKIITAIYFCPQEMWYCVEYLLLFLPSIVKDVAKFQFPEQDCERGKNSKSNQSQSDSAPFHGTSTSVHIHPNDGSVWYVHQCTHTS